MPRINFKFLSFKKEKKNKKKNNKRKTETTTKPGKNLLTSRLFLQ